MKILIVGGTGALGGHAAAYLAGKGHPQAAPELETKNFYIRSRRLADEGARAEAGSGFDVISVNAPFMVGVVRALPSQIFEPYVAWAQGKLPIPPFGPAGGTNFMSFRSLSQALEGALLRGESGKAYLVGAENLSFTDYFGLFFKMAGNNQTIEERDEAHPLLPDIAIPQGRGNWIRYEPDPEETALLGYARNDVANAVGEVFAQFCNADARAA
jgi:dihydroflavonol-4-reductase